MPVRMNLVGPTLQAFNKPLNLIGCFRNRAVSFQKERREVIFYCLSVKPVTIGWPNDHQEGALDCLKNSSDKPFATLSGRPQ